MEILTVHESDQISRLKAPLAWPVHPTCNGECQHGRACDFTADLEDDARPPMSRGSALIAFALMLAPWAVVALLAMSFGVWK